MIEIERGAGLALWRQIEEQLAAEIAAGRYALEGRLPTEQALSRRFGVNRHTLRRAVDALVRRGLLRVEQGRGIFVAEHAIDYTVGRRTRFSENLLRQGRQPGHHTLALGPAEADRAVARALKVKPGAAVIRWEGIGLADGRPVSCSVHHFPADRLPGFAEALAATRSVTAALARVGVADYRRRSTRVIGRLPSPQEATQLRLAPARPVLVTESINVDAEGMPVDFGVAVFVADRVQLVLDTP